MAVMEGDWPRQTETQTAVESGGEDGAGRCRPGDKDHARQCTGEAQPSSWGLVLPWGLIYKRCMHTKKGVRHFLSINCDL